MDLHFKTKYYEHFWSKIKIGVILNLPFTSAQNRPYKKKAEKIGKRNRYSLGVAKVKRHTKGMVTFPVSFGSDYKIQ